MDVVSTKVPADIREAIEDYAESQDITKSKATRDLLTQSITLERGEHPIQEKLDLREDRVAELEDRIDELEDEVTQARQEGRSHRPLSAVIGVTLQTFGVAVFSYLILTNPTATAGSVLDLLAVSALLSLPLATPFLLYFLTKPKARKLNFTLAD